jgi:carbon storage regulator CsrA
MLNMLTLSRKNGETIVITDGRDEITVTVSEIRGASVRLAIKANIRWKILRSEICPASLHAPSARSKADQVAAENQVSKDTQQ